jgi:hypothetical protein
MRTAFISILGALLLPGCLGVSDAPPMDGPASMPFPSASSHGLDDGLAQSTGGLPMGGDWAERKRDNIDARGEAGGLSAKDADVSAGERVTPRLIRTGNIAVVVDNFEPFQRELDVWLREAGGHVADASLSHADGSVGWGSLTLRVPSENLDALVGWTEERVQVESLSLQTSDVTAEWVDVESRIDNGRREEARLHDLLEDQTGSLADVLAVERELARVRGEIESSEGRMRVMADQVGMSTLTVQVQVRTPYAALLAPSFGDEAAAVFGNSVSALVATVRGAALIAVAAAPWLTPPLFFVLALVGLGRRRRQAPAR